MTKNTMINVLMFTSGAAIGSLVTWKIMKDKCERDIKAEVDAFKEEWSERSGKANIAMTNVHVNLTPEQLDDLKGVPGISADAMSDERYEPDQQTLFDYHNLASVYNTSNDDAEYKEEGERDEDSAASHVNGPYVIHPNDYGDGNYDYSLVCLTYYSDRVLADDWDVKQDIEDTIGRESLKHFGEYAEDVVHVRNERLRCDYEVVQDPRRYVDVIDTSPSKYTRET